MALRQPAVAGLFYSAGARELRDDLQAMLREAGNESSGPPPGATPKAMIVPHAGYVYSGPVAASGYRLLESLRTTVRRVVLFGPSHRVYLDGMAIPATDGFITPLGTVPLDLDALQQITTLPGVGVSDLAHSQEHSLEVQLPFLQLVLDDFKLVPVVVGQAAPAEVGRVIDALWGGPETLILISSDLSHYLAYDKARRIDGDTGRRIAGKVTTLTGQEACGAHAINGLMCAEHARALTVDTIDLRNSGDTAGDKTQVVGYGTFILH